MPMADARGDADRQAADWFLWLAEDPDDLDQRQRFTLWLAADPAHAAAWARISEAGEALSLAPAERWPGAALPRQRHRHTAARRLFARRSSAPRPARSSARNLAALAAAVALLLLVAALPTLGLYWRADHTTGTAETTTIALRDGSTVRLGPDSAVAIDDGQRERGVRLLAGRAWFEVAHDARRPFRVTAGKVTALDLGTGFEVSRLGDGNAAIAVSHGRVRVTDASKALVRDLGPGDWLQTSDTRLVQSGRERPELLGAWRGGSLTVANRSITDAVAELRPWYSGRIVIADDAIASQRVTGIYDLADPAATLESMVYPAGGKVLRITPWLMVVTAR